jgi:hypothetical protein
VLPLALEMAVNSNNIPMINAILHLEPLDWQLAEISARQRADIVLINLIETYARLRQQKLTNSIFLSAVEQADIITIKACLKYKDISLDVMNDALYVAVFKENKEVADLLLQSKAQITDVICRHMAQLMAKNKISSPLLKKLKHSAKKTFLASAFKGDIETVKTFVSILKDKIINVVTEEENTALLLAAAAGHSKVVEYLLDAGGMVNQKNKLNESPLYYAAKNGHEQTVKVLLSHGAKGNANIARIASPDLSLEIKSILQVQKNGFFKAKYKLDKSIVSQDHIDDSQGKKIGELRTNNMR